MKKIYTTAFALFLSLSAMAQGWPANYGGVMLQGFYWDSYEDTQWTTLEDEAEELSKYFDLIWVPNSGYCNTTTNFMGYLPIWWFNHLSAFGTEDELRSMIATYKELGTGIIEDVVINHKNGDTNWCDFPEETWDGQTLTWSLADICVGDDDGATEAEGYEISGAEDTGEDFYGGRDLDHTGENVQNNVKIYLDFLLNELGYTGFRYDMVKGYAPEYTSLYNQSAQPEFSVGEYWDGTTSNVKWWINGTKDDDGNIQSAAFDFPMKYHINDVFESASDWSTLNDNSLVMDSDYCRYAVTFIDNHDTYRTDDSSGDPLTANVEAANAFILSLPGTPCVFLPHLQQYEEAIKKLILVRKAAGITNQSSILLSLAQSDGYVLRVQGDNGKIQLQLGSPNISVDGYSLALEGTNYQLYAEDGIDLSALDSVEANLFDSEVVIPDFCTYDDDEMCAFFEAPTSWTDDIMCWAWNSSSNFTGGTWPGVECTYLGDTDEGKAVYKWEGGTLSDDIPTGIIFSNNGSPQTADLDFENGGYYTYYGLQAVVTGIADITVDATDAESGPVKVYSLDGRLLLTAPEGTSISSATSSLSKGVYIVNNRKYIVE